MGSTTRTILAAGAAAAATASVPRVFAQQAGHRGTGKFYERGPVRIYYEVAGSGLDDNQCTAPFEQLGERDQGEAPGRAGSPRLDLTFPEQGELLSEK